MLTPSNHKVLLAVASALLLTLAVVAQWVFDLSPGVTLGTMIVLAALLVWQFRNRVPYHPPPGDLHLR